MKAVHDLVSEHAAWIRRKAGYICKDENEAEDLAGETIYRCLRCSGNFNHSLDFKPWVVTIMRRLRRDELEKRRYLVVPESECKDLAESFDSSEMASFRLIVSTLKKLRRKHPQIDAVLLYAKGYSYEEIAQKLHIPSGTVGSRIHKGKKLISKALGL